MNKKFELNRNWKFSLRERNVPPSQLNNKTIKSNRLLPASVPGTIHTDLLKNKIIDDPYYSDNELRLDWINKCDWVYQTEFNFNKESDSNIDLIFEGLDTVCDIYLNNRRLGSTDNMFLTYKYNVNDYLKTKNLLKIIIKSPVNYALNQEIKFRKLPVALNSSRVYLRKAQYSFGWDWGPSFPTSGIWRNVYLQEWKDAKIDKITFNTNKIEKNYAEIEAGVELNFQNPKNLLLQVSISNGNFVQDNTIKISSLNKYKTKFIIDNPKLWWPNGEGEQNLYHLDVKILDDDNIIDKVQKNVGIRTINLITKEKDKQTFKFKVNNKDIYAKGVNWIPSDSFLPRVKTKKYSKLLSLAKDANVNIVRVWGGGVYEDNEFYHLCDQLGLLVWQDFMFACASYPEHSDFIENVKEEVEQNVLRIQHHACLAILCGNNENEWIWSQEQRSSYKEMPGYIIYHKVIPQLLKKIDPNHAYWPSTPFGFDDDPNSFTSGNTHQWNIWSRWIDYDEVKNDKSLFVTEFGFQGPANKNTLEKYISKKDRYITSEIFEHHNKQVEGPERVLKFLANHLPIKTDWDDYLYLAQLNQGLALKTCLEHWRTNRNTNGSIIWQINDSWPVVSWSIIDYEMNPKISYYLVKKSFAQQMIYFSNNKNRIDIYLLNQNKDIIRGNLRVSVIDGNSGEIYSDKFYKLKIDTKKKTNIFSLNKEDLPENNNWIVTAILTDKSGKDICRNFFLVKKWKHITLSNPRLSLRLSKNKNSLLLKTNKPTFFVSIYHPKYTLSDQGFFILPNEEFEVVINEKQSDEITKQDFNFYHLNNYLLSN
jgi:beta-mannosidase